MPLCTIFTKCPAPSGPMWVQHGAPSDVRGDRLEDRPERGVGLRRPAGHDRRAVQRALLAAGDPAADEVQTLLPQGRLAADGVGEVGVARVDHDVAGLEQRHELVDHRVGRCAGLDHHDHRARALQARDELRHRPATAGTCPRRRARPPATRCAPTTGCARRPGSRAEPGSAQGCDPSRQVPSPRSGRTAWTDRASWSWSGLRRRVVSTGCAPASLTFPLQGSAGKRDAG